MEAKGSSPRSFYKIILPSIIHDHKLRIPEAFAEIYENKLSSLASLVVPNGSVFRVQVEKADKKLWFHNGWKEFAEHYALRCGFFLIFEYEGKSVFKVNIYDLTATEIQYPNNPLVTREEPKNEHKRKALRKREERIMVPGRSSARHCPSYEEDKEVRASNECLLDDIVRKRCFHSLLPELSNFAPEFAMRIDKFEKCFPISSLDCLRSNIQVLTRNKRHKLEIKEGMSELVIVTTPKCTEKRKGITSGFADSENVETTTCIKKDKSLVEVKEKKAVDLALSLKLQNPYFMKVIKKDKTKGGFNLNVPLNFADKFLSKGLNFLQLENLDGQRWDATCSLEEQGVRFLSRGWNGFVWNNDLVEGDVCIFELVDVDDMVLKVHIFRTSQ